MKDTIVLFVLIPIYLVASKILSKKFKFHEGILFTLVMATVILCSLYNQRQNKNRILRNKSVVCAQIEDFKYVLKGDAVMTYSFLYQEKKKVIKTRISWRSLLNREYTKIIGRTYPVVLDSLNPSNCSMILNHYDLNYFELSISDWEKCTSEKLDYIYED
jgi:hypothetical protein